MLGSSPDIPGRYVEIERHPEAVPVAGILIIRLDSPIYYANALSVRAGIEELVKAEAEPPHAIVLDASVQDRLDITSADMLVKLIAKLQQAGIDVAAAEVHATVLDFARTTGLLAQLGPDNIFATVAHCCTRTPEPTNRVPTHNTPALRSASGGAAPYLVPGGERGEHDRLEGNDQQPS